MGSSKTTSTTKVEQSPEQRAIMRAAMDRYMPGGQLEDMPKWSPSQADAEGSKYVLGFNDDQMRAFQETRDRAFNWEPMLDEAAKYARGDADTIQSLMNPFQQNVIDRGLDEIGRARDIQLQGISDAAAKAGAFGGSRHGVAEAETSRGWADTTANWVGNTLYTGYNDAVRRSQDISRLLSDLAGQGQTMTGKSIDAILNVGNIIAGRDQLQRDVGYEKLQAEHLYPAQVAQMMMGFAPQPTTTTTSSGGTNPIVGAVGSAAASILPAVIFGSDEDLKEGIEDADPEDALAAIARLKPIEFDYTQDAQAMGMPAGRRAGFTAQDYEDVTGQPAPLMDNGFKGVDVGDLLGKVVQAIQALDERTRGLEAV